MPYAHPEALVSTAWLAEHLDDPEVKVIDASWYLPAEKRDPRAEYEAAHIPGAVYFDIDRIADTAIPLPHMFPDEATFAAEVGKLGIANGDHVVIYDGGKLTASARVWWMFRSFGHGRVSVLDGGAGKWRAEGRPMTAEPTKIRPAVYRARLEPARLRSLTEMREIVESRSEEILDARSAGRFAGTEPEPRAGLRSGHMPGAHCLPYPRLLRADGTMRPAEELRSLFEESGTDLARPVVTSCGSGVSAAVLLLGLHLIGKDDTALYDGSWSEWGAHPDTPVVT